MPVPVPGKRRGRYAGQSPAWVHRSPAGPVGRSRAQSSRAALTEHADTLLNAFESVEHPAQLGIIELCQHLVLNGEKMPADIDDRRLASFGKHDQLDPSIIRGGAALNMTARLQCIEQAHQAGAVDADQRGQILLTDPIAGFGEVDQWRPTDISQADSGHLLVDGPAPQARQHGEPDTEPVPRGKWLHG